MAAVPAPLDPNDPINILLMPFDPLPRAANVDAVAQLAVDDQASQAARDAEAEAEKQRKLAEEKANQLRQQTGAGGQNNATIFGTGWAGQQPRGGPSPAP